MAYGNHLYVPLDSSTERNTNIALFDTGAAFIHIPSHMHDVLVSLWKRDLDLHSDEFFLGRRGLWEAKVDSCAAISPKLGNFSIILGDHTFDLSPRAYLLDCADITASHYCSQPTNCLFGIDDFGAADSEYRSFNDNVFLLGDLFLKNFYTVYVAEEGSESYVQLALSK